MMIMSQNKEILWDTTGSRIEEGKLRDDEYVIIGYSSNFTISSDRVLGKYSSKAKAIAVLCEIMFEFDNKSRIYQMPSNEEATAIYKDLRSALPGDFT